MVRKIIFMLAVLAVVSNISFASENKGKINALIGKMVPIFLDFLYEKDQKRSDAQLEMLMPFFNWDSIFKRTGIVLDETNRHLLPRTCLLDIKKSFMLNKGEIEQSMHLGTIKKFMTESRVESVMSVMSAIDPEYSLEEDNLELILKWRGLTLNLEPNEKDELRIGSWSMMLQ